MGRGDIPRSCGTLIPAKLESFGVILSIFGSLRARKGVGGERERGGLVARAVPLGGAILEACDCRLSVQRRKGKVKTTSTLIENHALGLLLLVDGYLVPE